MTGLAVAMYRVLIRVLPPAWRAEHGDAMASTFESLVIDARRMRRYLER